MKMDLGTQKKKIIKQRIECYYLNRKIQFSQYFETSLNEYPFYTIDARDNSVKFLGKLLILRIVEMLSIMLTFS
jgi:hypothetical protein